MVGGNEFWVSLWSDVFPFYPPAQINCFWFSDVLVKYLLTVLMPPALKHVRVPLARPFALFLAS